MLGAGPRVVRPGQTLPMCTSPPSGPDFITQSQWIFLLVLYSSGALFPTSMVCLSGLFDLRWTVSFTFKRPPHSWKKMLIFCPQNYLEFWSSPTTFLVFPYLLEHRAEDYLPATAHILQRVWPTHPCTRNPIEPTLSHSEPPLLLILPGQEETTREHKKSDF